MAGNGSATARWVASCLEQFEAPLIGYAARLIDDRDRARDVVQDVFLALCRQDPDSLDGHVAAWLYRVCRNRALDVLRHEGRMTQLAQLTETPAPQLSEPAASSGSVLEALEQLRPRQREVLRLKFQAGLSYREIAEVTGLSTGNVGLIIHHALRAMRRRLQRPETTPPRIHS